MSGKKNLKCLRYIGMRLKIFVIQGRDGKNVEGSLLNTINGCVLITQRPAMLIIYTQKMEITHKGCHSVCCYI